MNLADKEMFGCILLMIALPWAQRLGPHCRAFFGTLVGLEYDAEHSAVAARRRRTELPNEFLAHVHTVEES
jgi:hypothetical protein